MTKNVLARRNGVHDRILCTIVLMTAKMIGPESRLIRLMLMRTIGHLDNLR